MDKNEPFYVGIGTKRSNKKNNEISAYYRAFTLDSRNNYWNNIVAQSKYEVDILLESDSKSFILKKEEEFIEIYGRKDLGSGTLVNLNDGGGKSRNMSQLVINKTLETKRKRGNLGNAKNLIDWLNSENYKNPKARYIYMYSAKDGSFLKKFNSLKSCGDFLDLKGSISHIIKKCDNGSVYISKYIFSWSNQGHMIDLNKYNTKDIFYQPVSKICPISGEILCTYDRMSEAAERVGTHVKNISDAIHRNHKSCGFFWRKIPLKQQSQS